MKTTYGEQANVPTEPKFKSLSMFMTFHLLKGIAWTEAFPKAKAFADKQERTYKDATLKAGYWRGHAKWLMEPGRGHNFDLTLADDGQRGQVVRKSGRPLRQEEINQLIEETHGKQSGLPAPGRVSLGTAMAISKYMSSVEPLERHPLNQILYGPPGTGKTWNAVNHAMAIVKGAKLDEIGDEDRAQFHAFRFDPEAGIGQITMVTFHQSFSYEDFVEGIRPRLDGEEIGYELRDGVFKRIANAARKDEDPEKRYVLIIDEINRGNIPKIFGELITLVEDSKRLGEDDGMSVTLPYSNQDFGVPSNLYIIGTMNTADRSILLLDTALRRRFDFVEMMPDPEHNLISNNVGGVDARKMLKAMNERISLLLDREHQIGHTYLFDVNDLKSLSDKFQNKIFPLLQEYFYDDWSKIREVLGGAGFVSEQKLGYAKQLRDSDFVDADRKVYERLPEEDSQWLEADEYKKIYSDDSASESP